MPIVAFDHVNILTAQLDTMTRWYVDVLGLKTGPRPPFSVGGTWLYLDDQPFVHLVEAQRAPSGDDPKLEHFAFRATGLAEFLGSLTSHGIDYRIAEVPEFPIVQVNFHDPDGIHIHVDFPRAEYDVL